MSLDSYAHVAKAMLGLCKCNTAFLAYISVSEPFACSCATVKSKLHARESQCDMSLCSLQTEAALNIIELFMHLSVESAKCLTVIQCFVQHLVSSRSRAACTTADCALKLLCIAVCMYSKQ